MEPRYPGFRVLAFDGFSMLPTTVIITAGGAYAGSEVFLEHLPELSGGLTGLHLLASG